jgi:choline dehydrogenase-like flavoprotein
MRQRDTGRSARPRLGDRLPGPAAVVEPTLLVHGVPGLRVADASVMPAVPSGNTNIPTVALAERAAELVLRGAG